MRGSTLLTPILADPSDTASRLVHGDWLAEQGDPRGTFIAYQCRLADMDGLEADYPMT